MNYIPVSPSGSLIGYGLFSVYDIRELLSSSVKLMDGKSPLEIDIPGANLILKPVLHFIKGTVIEKVLRDYDVLKDDM